ncbi:hypothetical protein E2C01_055461 [Portunus trituberculatus]|uniref:Uncharacterized protein n=1 Tax=Portunus trituberculatus TaxID=210409 RepID=A0A5B7GV23_PORTR|nr:hypothetical protein [Portunus trituberculatus]
MDTPHCLWCPMQPNTPEHLLPHCLHHHSHHTAFLHFLSSLHICRPSLADLFEGFQDSGLAFNILMQEHQSLPSVAVQLARITCPLLAPSGCYIDCMQPGLDECSPKRMGRYVFEQCGPGSSSWPPAPRRRLLPYT